MPLKLNQIADDRIDAIVKEGLADLEKRLAVGPPSDDLAQRIKYFRVTGNTSFDVGACLYQQEQDAREIRRHLARAGEFLLRAHTLRERPAANESRSPFEFEKTVSLVVCFCGFAERDTASKVHKWQYRNPVNVAHDAYGRYLELLQGFIVHTPLDAEAASAVENHCASDTANKWERTVLLPQIQGLRAVAAVDPGRWRRALSELVKAHEREATRGELKMARSGLVCLTGLLLAKLGMERDMRCDVQSPYLPWMLLEPTT
jgi:hypothetical protein